MVGVVLFFREIKLIDSILDILDLHFVRKPLIYLMYSDIQYLLN